MRSSATEPFHPRNRQRGWNRTSKVRVKLVNNVEGNAHVKKRDKADGRERDEERDRAGVGRRCRKRGAIEEKQTSLLGLCLFVLLSVCVFIFRVLSLFPTTSHEASCCQEPSCIPVASVLHKP